MNLQLWRNATIQISTTDFTLLIDPMLGEKGSFGAFPWTDDQRANPLIDLPFTYDAVETKLKHTDAVFVSHLHPDHWDEKAIELLDKTKPIICPEPIAEAIASYGFQNIKAINESLVLNGLELSLTQGKHGIGEIGKKMGLVNGLIISHDLRKIYVAGDTIWCDEVKEEIDLHQPQHIIVAGGAATFAIGDPVTMTAEQIEKLAYYSPQSTIWVTHLEAIAPCTQDRQFLSEFFESKGLQNQIKILEDGEEVRLDFQFGQDESYGF